MEANQWSWHATAHACDAPNDGGHYNNCDRGCSCKADVHDLDHDAYGPGNNYQINTLESFHARIDFHEENGQFSGYTVKLSQDDNELVLGCYDSNDVNIVGMSEDIENGMAFAMSNWSSGDLHWLQGGRCQGGCGSPSLSFDNLVFGTANAPQ